MNRVEQGMAVYLGKERLAFLQKVNKGEMAQHSFNRLVEWGYINKSGQRLK